MRLGSALLGNFSDAAAWASLVKKSGYSSALCPVNADASDTEIASYAIEAKKNGIVIAEVGAWSNPLSSDETVKNKALAYCKEQLALADQIGANCCVNIAGSRSSKWDGPHKDNFKKETFDMIVDTVRDIIDSVKPIRTFYTLEPMPWMFPDSIENYAALIKAVDRKAFGVHLDPVNMISSPQKYFDNRNFLRECFKVLGPYIKSCHAKDVLMNEDFVTHISEVAPGYGILDYKIYITEMNKVNKDLPLIIEHLNSESEYKAATDYILSVAASLT